EIYTMNEKVQKSMIGSQCSTLTVYESVHICISMMTNPESHIDESTLPWPFVWLAPRFHKKAYPQQCSSS
ncbi:MAG: hypothetical protein ACKPKO_24890, partial [Candidatus Fonsibacter sp.]